MVFITEEYNTTQRKWIEKFCDDYYNKNQFQHIFKKITVQCRRLWSYGLVAIVAHAFTGHSLYRKTTISSSSFLLLVPRFNTTNMLILEITLWSAGVSIAYYIWLSQIYVKKIKQKTKTIMDNIQQTQQESKSNTWVLIDSDNHHDNNNNHKKLLGVAIFNYKKESENEDEGQIQVIAENSQMELTLVKHAIQYARQQNIKVVTRKNKSDPFF
ncbi:unnamed protein product [Cunninghamella blakesleeana]